MVCELCSLLAIFINFEVVLGGVHEHGSNWSVGDVYISFYKKSTKLLDYVYKGYYMSAHV